MRKGTTPIFEFELPSDFDISAIENAKATFSFDGDVKVEKYLCDCKQDGHVLKFKLTQEETFLFECNSYVSIQLRVVTVAGEAFTSDPFEVFAYKCFDSEVLE